MEKQSPSGHKARGSHSQQRENENRSANSSTPKKRKGNWKKQSKKSNKSPRDETDRIGATSNNEIEVNDNSTRSSPNVADMTVHRDADEYNMQHKNRGYAIIFNHYMFKRKLGAREGTEHDVTKLKTKFSTLGFDVIVYDGRTLDQIRGIILDWAKDDHSDNDCLAVIVLTHDNSDGQCEEENLANDVDSLWEPFTSDKCPSLAGKPKLFFIQAYRGVSVGKSNTMKTEESSNCVESDNRTSYSIPTTADFLMAYSTLQDFVAMGNPDSGSWFIECLCDELNTEDDLLQILVKTNRRVALRSPSEPDKHKQMPLINTTFTRDLYFRPKE